MIDSIDCNQILLDNKHRVAHRGRSVLSTIDLFSFNLMVICQVVGLLYGDGIDADGIKCKMRPQTAFEVYLRREYRKCRCT